MVVADLFYSIGAAAKAVLPDLKAVSSAAKQVTADATEAASAVHGVTGGPGNDGPFGSTGTSGSNANAATDLAKAIQAARR